MASHDYNPLLIKIAKAAQVNPETVATNVRCLIREVLNK